MNLHFIDWIWRVKGTLLIDPPQSCEAAFSKLDTLFKEKGTTYDISNDTLTFKKEKQLSQDKMSIFNSGTLRITDGTLHYDMASKALLACFLAPLLFFIVGHAGIAIDKYRNPPEQAAAKAAAAEKRSKVKPEDVPMNPVDVFLGAPKPDKKKDGEKIGSRNKKPSLTRTYVFMAVFFSLWLFGRILEHKMIHHRFRKILEGR